MGAGGMKRPGGGMSAMQRPGNPMQKQGGSMSPSTLSQLPPGIQQAIAARNSQQGGPGAFPQMQKQGGPMQQMPQNPMQQMPMDQQGGFPQMSKQGGMPPWAGSGLIPAYPQDQMQQMQPQQFPQMGKQGGPMQQGGYPPYLGPMMGQQGGPMQGGMAGGKGGMPGAAPNPNAMQQFSQQQGLAGMLGPQQSSTNSLQ